MNQISPLTAPLDHPKLKDNKPKLVYDEKNGIICDLMGERSKNLSLEKICAKVIKKLDKYNLTTITPLQREQVDMSIGLIARQVFLYKEKHEGCWGSFVLWWRSLFVGHIDELSVELDTRLQALKMLPNPDKGPAGDVEKPMQEFIKTEKEFLNSIGAACRNIDSLITLSHDASINCTNPFFRETTKDLNLANCAVAFDKLRVLASVIEIRINEACQYQDPTTRNSAIARIFATEEYHYYVVACTQAADYYTLLLALVEALINENQWTPEMIQGLNLHGQPADTDQFKFEPKDRLRNIVAQCFAPAVQRVMRQEMLAETFEKMTPYNDPSYPLILNAYIEAKRNANAMNLGR